MRSNNYSAFLQRRSDMNPDEIAAIIPSQVRDLFDDIRYSRVLGANKHIEMIGSMISAVANEAKNKADLFNNTDKVVGYFKETRGNQSRAVYNAINEMMFGVDKLSTGEIETIKEYINKRIENYKNESENNIKKICNLTNNICENYDTILIFDYSSTINAAVENLNKKMNIYIPESRALDGGRPFVKSAIAAGHKTYFIPDTTMYEALKKCQAAFIGAESFYPDGTIFNTIGSDIVAILCENLGIPLYVLTPMMKVDVRSVQGYNRLSPMPYNYMRRLTSGWDEGILSQVDFSGNKLVDINSKYIKAIVTEKGIIPAHSMFNIAIDYASELEGKEYV